VILRPYQRAAVDATFSFLSSRPGNPILSLPTGSGKSVVLAAFLKQAIEWFPNERFLVVSHVREIVQQDLSKLLAMWPEAPVGVYSAGLDRREVRQITIAGIQSIYRKPEALGDIGAAVVDECHLVPRDGAGMYLSLLDGLRRINPHLRVVGLTATPYRLDSGPLVEGEGAIFNGIAYEADLLQLIRDGYLCPLKSRIGVARTNLRTVRVRGGEFIPGELEAAMNRDDLVAATVDEIVELLAARNKWLIFCAGVEHAVHVAAVLRDRGVPADAVYGEMSTAARDGILDAFNQGELRAVTNVNVLNVGFDQPDIDALVMLRPTLSTGLYVQQCGRGMRPHPSKVDTLLADFSGNVLRHGPLTSVRPVVRARKDAESEAGFKECPRCHSVVEDEIMVCPECGYTFHRDKREYKHHTDADDERDVMGVDNLVVADVDYVEYNRHEKVGKIPSMRVTYYCRHGGRNRIYNEWVCLEHEGFPGKKAQGWLKDHGAYDRHEDGDPVICTVDQALLICDTFRQPLQIIVDTSEKYARVISHRGWREQEEGDA
jgi:DNA repair protein RadD